MSIFILPAISFLSEIAVLAVAVILRRLLATNMRVLAAYFLSSVLMGVVQILFMVQHIENLWTLQVFLPVEFILFLLVFYFTPGLSQLRWLILISIVLFLVAWSSTFTWTNTMSPSFPYLKTAAALVLIGLSCYTLIRMLRDEEPAPLKQPLFWVAAGNLISFGSTVLLFALTSRIFELSTQTMRIAWSTGLATSVIANSMYFKGFLCLRRK